jgi:hypothetical protein
VVVVGVMAVLDGKSVTDVADEDDTHLGAPFISF